MDNVVCVQPGFAVQGVDPWLASHVPISAHRISFVRCQVTYERLVHRSVRPVDASRRLPSLHISDSASSAASQDHRPALGDAVCCTRKHTLPIR